MRSPWRGNRLALGCVALAALALGPWAGSALAVTSPPQIAVSFGATSIPVGGTTALTFTVTNPNASTSLAGVAFSDSLPPGLVVSTPNGESGVCPGATITATAGASTVSLSNATLAGGANCVFSVNVTASSAGVETDSVAVTSTTAGPGNTATAQLIVAAPPSIALAFAAPSVPIDGSTTLSFTISNPNGATALAGVNFTDALPGGLVLGSSTGLTTTCAGANITANAGDGSIRMLGASIPAGGSCTLSTVAIVGTSAGLKLNSVTVSSTTGGTGNTASALLTVVGPPQLALAFGSPSIPLDGSTTLTITIANGNVVPLSGIALNDGLPAGMIGGPPATSNCGGTLAVTPVVVSLSGGNLDANSSCQATFEVTGVAAGAQTDFSDAVGSSEGGMGAPASATLSVVAPPTIAAQLSPSSIPSGATATLSLTLSNPPANADALTGVAVTDSLPAGLVVASPSGLSGTCAPGTITAAAGSSTVTLAGGAIAVGGMCTFSVNVTAASPANLVDTTGVVSSTNGGAGATASASLTVGAPTLATSFGAASIPLGATTRATFTVANPNTTALSAVGFSDSLPAGLAVSTPNGLSDGCPSGAITATAGSATVALAGAALAPEATCTFAVNVIAITPGAKQNVTGNIASDAVSGASASASTTVVAPPTITATFGARSIYAGASTPLTITVANPGVNAGGLSGVGFSDALPAGLLVANPSALSDTCGGTLSAGAQTASVVLSGATLGAGGACTIRLNVTAAAVGAYTNATGPVSSAEGGSGGGAVASLTVTAVPVTIPPPPAPPSNAFTIKSIAARPDGAVVLTLALPGPGRVTAAPAHALRHELIRSTAGVAKSAGRLKLTLHPTATAARALRKATKLRVRVRVTYTPTGGTAHGRTVKLTFRRARA